MVRLPNNEQIAMTLCGDIKLSSKLLLHNVLFVPQFKFNLNSVSALATDCKLTIHFFPNYFVIQDLTTKMMIGKGDKHDALYVLDTSTIFDQQFSGSTPILSAQVNKVSAHVWHERHGHLSFQRSEFLQPQLHCNTKHDTHVPCYIYPLAKQHRLSFSSHNHMSKSPFDLVHCDIWGPFHVPSITGYKFFLTLVDDHTRFTWIHLLKHKSYALTVIPKFFKLVQT